MATTGASNVENVAPTAAAGGDGSNASVIITVAACVGSLFLLVLIIFIIFVIYFYHKQPKDDEFAKRKPSMRADRLDWKSHSLPQQFGDINDIDEMLWKEGGRTSNDNTDNPAYGRDFEPLDVNNLKGFDSTDEEAGSTQQTESSSDLVEINMEEGDGGDGPQDEADKAKEDRKQISILDMKTWGQPGASRRNSIRSVSDFGAPPPFAPRSPGGPNSLRSQSGNPFPLAGVDSATGRRPSMGRGAEEQQPQFPFSVSGPSNDPRFEYTRTNPLLGNVAMRQGANHYPPGLKAQLTGHEHRDFGGVQDLNFEGSGTLHSSRRNQSVVDTYESGTRTTSSNFNLSLKGSGSVGTNLLWQNKKFGQMGFKTT